MTGVQTCAFRSLGYATDLFDWTERRLQDVLYVQVGTGIGAGLMSHGALHWGADGAAGDIGHVRVSGSDAVVCRCGRTGCLEAVAGGWAVLRDARRAGAEGISPFLRERLGSAGDLTIDDVVAGVAAARVSGINYGEGLIKNRYVGRTFIMPTLPLGIFRLSTAPGVMPSFV